MKHDRIQPAVVGLFTLLAIILPWLTGNIYYLHVATVIGIYWVLHRRATSCEPGWFRFWKVIACSTH